MNNERRKRIATLQEELRSIGTAIEEIANDEREAMENLPESFQEGEQGERMEETATALEEIQGQIDEAVDALDDTATN